MERTLKEQFQERLCKFQEKSGLEQALRQQMTTAIELHVLEALHNPTTGSPSV